MTTCRQLCCNDLLRIGALSFFQQCTPRIFISTFQNDLHNPQMTVIDYQRFLGIIPQNCQVAYGPRGRIAACIVGGLGTKEVAGEGLYFNGKLKAFSLTSMDLLATFGRPLVKLVEDACGMMFESHSLLINICADNMLVRQTCIEWGYVVDEEYPSYGLLGMRKPVGEQRPINMDTTIFY